ALHVTGVQTCALPISEDPTRSRMTIVTSGSDDVIEQINKQLNKLVDVVKVVDLSEGEHIERELMLVKVRAVGKDREEMKRMADKIGRASCRERAGRRV